MRNLEVLENMRNVIATWKVELNSLHDSGFNACIRKVVAYLDTILNLEAAATPTTDLRDEQIRVLREALEDLLLKQDNVRFMTSKDSAWIEFVESTEIARKALADTQPEQPTDAEQKETQP